MAWTKEEELRLRKVIKDSGVNLLKENLPKTCPLFR